MKHKIEKEVPNLTIDKDTKQGWDVALHSRSLKRDFSFSSVVLSKSCLIQHIRTNLNKT